MENLELTHEEKKKIGKHGFIVKILLSKKGYFVTLFSYFSLYILCNILLFPIITFLLGNLSDIRESYLMIEDTLITTIYWVNLVVGLFIIPLYITYKYSIFQHIMISDGGIIANNSIYKSKSDIPIKILKESMLINKVGGNFINWISHFPLSAGSIILGRFIIWLFLLGITGIALLISGLFFLVGNIIVTLTQKFIPFSQLINLGEKIQKLTPQIAEKSKQIQSEFQSDMNFSVLSNGFDSLSSTFSSIVTLVIKLEKVEARANKGNLFDSEKYINSLRSDIVTPLTSLRTFLEKQKTELIQSQRELTRVRVGGSESSGNIELQSKRSESLIQELTENIEKLEVMVGKMGNK